MQAINGADLINMAERADELGYRIDMMYADADHPYNIFQCALYRADAPLLLHKTFAPIIHQAASLCAQRSDYTLVLHDGLRVSEAQQAMSETDIVRKNPDWLEDQPGRGRLLSPPGRGAHPRGMAIDISLLDKDGTTLDFGTIVDEMSPLSHRKATGLSDTAQQNRAFLTKLICDAAQECDVPILPLPSEWWDFRFPAEIYNDYAPLRDTDLPVSLRLIQT